MNWKKKLVLDASVFLLFFLLSGAVCLLATGTGRECLGMLLWPLVPLAWGESFQARDGWAWWVWNPALWLALAAGLAWLFIRQFWRSDRLSAWMGAAAEAVWWLAGLFWKCSSWHWN